MIAAFRSSSDANAVSWNSYICWTIAEISFDAAVITVRVIAFLNTSIRRVAVPMPSGRTLLRCAIHSCRCCAIRSHQQSDRFCLIGPPTAGHPTPHPRRIAAAVVSGRTRLVSFPDVC
ncbi:hypothetical protein FOPG_18609 [Fusarium oxysporum f. sp. conglutinans race 2 54008]|uniref:Uncharacterized protein n=1 Tax=Fusarium oxysporum f. sp. conglutinans race 2 54008 TaxID=1089457 RepID=X0GPB6_FUSOX|nr:hypothetical protein FOPG_18609 [Fusarium oxysporum f. sp. conglutinans race 2 54008]